MGEANPWGRSRFIILLAVVGIHVGLGLLLMMASRTRVVDLPSVYAIQVLLLPPVKAARVRAANLRPQRLRTDIALGLAPPDFSSSSQSGNSAAPDGHGPAVNWAAEAHRALRAFEIRRDQPTGSAQSVSAPLEEWSRAGHHAGDQFTTDDGDWLVWINADCYQVASWRAHALSDPAPSQTVCRARDVPR